MIQYDLRYFNQETQQWELLTAQQSDVITIGQRVEAVDIRTNNILDIVNTINNRTSNVDNTRDIDKPMSTATSVAINNHANKRVQDMGGVHGLAVESGTWTPIFCGSNGADTLGVAEYDRVTARYYRIGNIVSISAHLIVRKFVGNGGYYCVRGLPFSPSISSEKQWVNSVSTLKGGYTGEFMDYYYGGLWFRQNYADAIAANSFEKNVYIYINGTFII